MSDLMLLGVLQMPIEMVMSSELSTLQYIQRGHEAAARIKADADLIEQQAARIAELEACSAAAASAEPFGWVKPAGGNYFTRSALSARRIGGLVPVYTAPVADSAMAKDAEEPSLQALYEDACIAANKNAKDAERYRWLREQRWEKSDMFVVAGSKSKVMLGTDCPSLARLDAAIDAALQASKEQS